MHKFIVNFNSIDMPSFLKVKSVNTSILPEVKNNFQEIVGGVGLIDGGFSIGGKVISLDIILVVPEDKSLLEIQRELAWWLKGDNFKLSPLVISDECQLEYMAKVDSSVDISDLTYIGEGTINFIVPSGMAINRNIQYGAIEGNKKIVVDYIGTAEAFPTFKFTPSQDYSNTTLRISDINRGINCLVTGNFEADKTITINCDKKFVKINDSLNLNMINLESEWLSIESRRLNVFSYNLEGEMEMSYFERWL